MATLTFTGSSPTPRQKSVLVVGQVNAEPITVVVDESWSGLQLELQFFNSTTHPEVPVVVILDSTMTCKVPPEVTKEVGIVHVALAGRDSGTIIKLSEKLYYADAKIGADPQGGLTPEQQTPDYIAQMVALQEQAAYDAAAAKDAAERAADSVASAGPYAEEAKKSAEAAKTAANAATTSAQQAAQAAKDAQTAAGSIGDAVQRAEGAATNAEAAKTAAEAAKTTAAESARAAQSAAQDAGGYLDSVKADAQAAATAATEAGKSQKAARDAAQEAANARDQANTAVNTARDHATAASTAKDAAEQAAATAGGAQSGAAQSAQSAAGSASAAQAAQQAAEAAAAVLPTPTPEDAGKVPVVQPDGTFGLEEISGGGSAGGWVKLRDEITESPVLVFAESGLSKYSVIYFHMESTMEAGGSRVWLFINDDTASGYSLAQEATLNQSMPFKSMYGFIFKGPDDSINCLARTVASANLGSSLEQNGTTVYKKLRWSVTFPVEKISIKSSRDNFGAGSIFKVYAKEGL